MANFVHEIIKSLIQQIIKSLSLQIELSGQQGVANMQIRNNP